MKLNQTRIYFFYIYMSLCVMFYNTYIPRDRATYSAVRIDLILTDPEDLPGVYVVSAAGRKTSPSPPLFITFCK